MDMTIVFGVGMFTLIVFLLVILILFARSHLVSAGDVHILINGERTIAVPAGGKLLQTLSEAKLFLPSACGGGGTCAQCKCIITEETIREGRLPLLLTKTDVDGGVDETNYAEWLAERGETA